MAGRPSSLTPQVHDQIVDAIRRGAYIETAAQAAGVTKKSFYQWLKIG
jgi:transposase-like protein